MHCSANQSAPSPEPYILIAAPKHQVENAISAIDVSYGCKEFLRNVNFRRNPKNLSLVFAEIKTFAYVLRRSESSIKRYIKEAEEAGYLFVEEQVIIKPDRGAQYISNNYYFTTLLLNPKNSSLKEKILAFPVRQSKIKSKDVSHRKPTIFKKKVTWGGFKNDTSILIKDNTPINTIHKTTTEKPAQVVVQDSDFSFVKLNEAEEVLKAYTEKFHLMTMAQRAKFKSQYCQGGYEREKMLAQIEAMHSCPILKYSTFSPLRLFSFVQHVAPMSNAIFKRVSEAFRGYHLPEDVIPHLMQDESIRKWFGGNLKNMHKALVELSTQC